MVILACNIQQNSKDTAFNNSTILPKTDCLMLTSKLFLALSVMAWAVTTLFIPGSSSAQDLSAETKKSERNYRKTITGNGALTQQMLEACIRLKAEIDEEYKKINASKHEFDLFNNEVKKRAAEMPAKTEVPLIEYNKQVNLYNSKLDELKELETAYNEKSKPYRKKTAQFKKECNDQPYYEDDYAAAVEKTGNSL
ncbi:MAG: hypothetical protein D3916_07270 [Candidatus Electrothrix sp. MAN1_4]|nr:hypothetical protein [Candidatus Electrothrix sp. MAN1_4]